MKSLKTGHLLPISALLLGLALIPSYAQAGEAGKATTMFQDPPNAAEVLEALGEKPKTKFRGMGTKKTRAIVVEGESDFAPPSAADTSAPPPTPAQARQEVTPTFEPPVASAPAPAHDEEQVRPAKKQAKAPSQSASQSGHQSASQSGKKTKVVALPIYFDSGSAEMTEQAQTFADPVGQALQQKPDMNIHISGHTDVTGGESVNRPLSLRRAEAVKQYMVEKYQIDPSRITVSGEGSSQLLKRNNPRADENRRVEFVKNAD
ncbi:MAG: OmpA family protein [Magnetococcus sp. YQC-5]